MDGQVNCNGVARPLPAAGGALETVRALLGSSSLDRASLLRHAAIITAAVAACRMPHGIAVGPGVVAVLAAAAVLNLATVRLSDAAGWAVSARCLSSAFGVGGWAVLSALTGGLASPFVAGFWLEIVFSAIALPPWGSLAATAWVVIAVWIEQALFGSGAGLGHAALVTGFVVGTGALTFHLGRRWARAQRRLAFEATALGDRLRALETELEASRTFRKVGEQAARLAHSLKSSVNSLRGFAEIIETHAHAAGSPLGRRALDGLRLAIDRLESTARTALRDEGAGAPAGGETSAAELRRTIDDVVAQVSAAHAGVRWAHTALDARCAVKAPCSVLREVLLIVVENAAEATGPSGEIAIHACAGAGTLSLTVRDGGPGIAPDVGPRLFTPGSTTKPGGHGLGLTLARRLVEAHGGRLTIANALGGGARVSLTLPARETGAP
jgi:signal transduction histidine kinase